MCSAEQRIINAVLGMNSITVRPFEESSTVIPLPYNLKIKPDGSNSFAFAVAGYKKENISISSSDGMIHIEIAAQSTDQSTAQEELELVKHIHTGIKYKAIKFSLPIRSEYDIHKLTVGFDSGILLIDVPLKPITKSTFELT